MPPTHIYFKSLRIFLTAVLNPNTTNLNLYRIKSANGGQYSTVFTTATPNDEGNGENENRSFVSFIVRIVTSNGTHYTWQVQHTDSVFCHK